MAGIIAGFRIVYPDAHTKNRMTKYQPGLSQVCKKLELTLS
ncbi:hypothetical protein [Bacillus paralicheniformis]|nr:hypothetical protein [Bacillus paralicheniformis]MEC1021616.1 hypothetical protein [Bacillus paralicheniformis]MEC1024989.1 hypothetical protein [Bacillus paralicheniformis]MEC1033080.1 hypothetical protein [Bacillus paralicheniformis]MEC1051896.1 hypothetical protein [Bacillus paralicheniformis]MEC1061223.1 hypothetical protein [Bacillus paralicheniformis]